MWFGLIKALVEVFLTIVLLYLLLKNPTTSQVNMIESSESMIKEVPKKVDDHAKEEKNKPAHEPTDEEGSPIWESMSNREKTTALGIFIILSKWETLGRIISFLFGLN